MRLINAATLELEQFMGGNGTPEYAILSHTWGAEEVTFQDHTTQKTAARKKLGFAKIEGSCWRGLMEGIDYVWVDTMCIDKSSSAELSEAINSMFAWYQKALRCYVYLADVSASGGKEAAIAALPGSRWFTRGWTLQELLAPSDVVFYSQEWTYLGTKDELVDEISAITGIQQHYLKDSNAIFSAAVAARMSWFRGRTTTRVEDTAYCMLGIFNINMPLLYGEGENAFLRLQEEIIKVSDDQTIFCWTLESTEERPTWQNILAPHPTAFRHAGGFVPRHCEDEPGAAYAITNSGLSMTLACTYTCGGLLAALDVVWNDGRGATPIRAAIHLSPSGDRGQWARAPYPPMPVPVVKSHARAEHNLFLRCRGITRDHHSAGTPDGRRPSPAVAAGGEAIFLTFDRLIQVAGTHAPACDDRVAPAQLDRAGSSVWLPPLPSNGCDGDNGALRRACIFMAVKPGRKGQSSSPSESEVDQGAMFLAGISPCSASATAVGDTDLPPAVTTTTASGDGADRTPAASTRWYAEVTLRCAGLKRIRGKPLPASPLCEVLDEAESGELTNHTAHWPLFSYPVTVISQLPRFGDPSAPPWTCNHTFLGVSDTKKEVNELVDDLKLSGDGGGQNDCPLPPAPLYPSLKIIPGRSPSSDRIRAINHLGYDRFVEMLEA